MQIAAQEGKTISRSFGFEKIANKLAFKSSFAPLLLGKEEDIKNAAHLDCTFS